jgi:hypothetical protein
MNQKIDALALSAGLAEMKLVSARVDCGVWEADTFRKPRNIAIVVFQADACEFEATEFYDPTDGTLVDMGWGIIHWDGVVNQTTGTPEKLPNSLVGTRRHYVIRDAMQVAVRQHLKQAA